MSFSRKHRVEVTLWICFRPLGLLLGLLGGKRWTEGHGCLAVPSLQGSHFHCHTFIFTISLSHFHFHTFTLLLSHLHIFTFTLSHIYIHIFTLSSSHFQTFTFTLLLSRIHFHTFTLSFTCSLSHFHRVAWGHHLFCLSNLFCCNPLFPSPLFGACLTFQLSCSFPLIILPLSHFHFHTFTLSHFHTFAPFVA